MEKNKLRHAHELQPSTSHKPRATSGFSGGAGVSREWLDLSPSPDRIGRAAAWIEREDGFVLMTGLEWGGWTLPGGGIHPGETAAQASVREAWEEAGAHCEVAGEPVTLHGLSGVDAICYPLCLTHLEPSPEGRPVAWVNPRQFWWACDQQIAQVRLATGQGVPSAGVRAAVQPFRRRFYRVLHTLATRST